MRKQLKVSALNGVAPLLAGGTTLHTLFKLPVEKNEKIVGNLAPLTGNESLENSVKRHRISVH